MGALYNTTGNYTLTSTPTRIGHYGRKKVLVINSQPIGLILRKAPLSPAYAETVDSNYEYAELPAGVWPFDCDNEIYLRSLPSGPTTQTAYIAVDRIERQAGGPYAAE